MKPYLYIFLSLFLLASCKSGYRDVSNDPKFSHFLGARYSVISQLKIHGVANSTGKNKKIDFYLITDLPGVGGPEILEQKTLDSKDSLTIKKVIECMGCLPTTIYFVVELDSNHLSINKEIEIWLEDLSIPAPDSSVAIMNPARLKRLE